VSSSCTVTVSRLSSLESYDALVFAVADGRVTADLDVLQLRLDRATRELSDRVELRDHLRQDGRVRYRVV
jgi:hypothetical protein